MKIFFLCQLLRVLVVLAHTFRFVIQFELIDIYDVTEVQLHLL